MSSTDSWRVGDLQLTSRFLLGTAGYPSPQVLADAIAASGTQIVTVGLKRQLAAAGDNGFVDIIRSAMKTHSARLLPNTAGCTTAREAIQLAHMARELYGTPWVKLEVVGDEYTLQPDPVELVEAARHLSKDGFVVFPYCTDDLVTCKRLLDAGCPLLMPWGAPMPASMINGTSDRRSRSHAAQALEMGFDAVLLNSAVSQASDPVRMAAAFKAAIEAGRTARLAGVMAKQDFAVATTPVAGNPFLIN